VRFSRSERDGVAGVQVVGLAVHDHACSALEDDEQFVHVGMRVGGENFARRDNDARDLGEWRQLAFAEPDLFLRRRIVTDRFFGCAVDAAEMHKGWQDERLRDQEAKRSKDREIQQTAERSEP